METRLIIERKGGAGLDWDTVAHPVDNIDEAKKNLQWLRDKEQNKNYMGKFRIVRETREIIDD